MLGGIVGGFVLTFVTVASELSATIVLYSGPWTTMTIAMFQALEGTSPGDCGGRRDRADHLHAGAGRAGLSPAAAARTLDALKRDDSGCSTSRFSLLFGCDLFGKPLHTFRIMPWTEPMIDLRSDTITLPTEEMREAMHRAELGDDSRDGDPTVRRLEETAAEIPGKEAGLFVASGTMSNLVALLAHTGRGGEVLLDAEFAYHAQRTRRHRRACRPVLPDRTVHARRAGSGRDRGALSERLAPNKLATALVCVETTHNSAGGAVIPLDYLGRLRTLTTARAFPCTSTAHASSMPLSRSASPSRTLPAIATASASASARG